ncbi:MAG: hypothetical protein A4E24_00977 [Methanomethylovorans sp. PtaU1.Bin093]|jgi:hypothetical protein|uniref:DUF1538 domain-containing protein n=1 Tax=Methanomethylovorans sp. PtaU1.Bin093 TaxID=1811679 RepID=UPI0009CFDB6F|nr:DUF1538 domain-containing protein [Methanomethylovorans sp. PtaU1.Bin093]OPY20643.1 MAG: hypothetical protein A4E24_00977 [Methanomethylovorans sp. PtaU1.Bin093]
MEGIIDITIEVLLALIPIVIFFMFFQLRYLKLPSFEVTKILIGMLMTAIGMIIFLYGVYNGLYPIGFKMGEFFGNLEQIWILIPLGFILGFLATFAEPAVRVLSYQIEKSSSGYIRAKLMLYTLSFGVAVFVAVAMAKIVYGIPFLYIIVPGYLLALVLLWLSDKDFIGIAFDAGGVATGPMAVTFLMSMVVGMASGHSGRDAVVDGFGLIAMIALAPIIFVMLLGIYVNYKRR